MDHKEARRAKITELISEILGDDLAGHPYVHTDPPQVQCVGEKGCGGWIPLENLYIYPFDRTDQNLGFTFRHLGDCGNVISLQRPSGRPDEEPHNESESD